MFAVSLEVTNMIVHMGCGGGGQLCWYWTVVGDGLLFVVDSCCLFWIVVGDCSLLVVSLTLGSQLCGGVVFL